MTLAMMCTTSCKPFSQVSTKCQSARARVVLCCAQEARPVHFAAPAAKALTAAAAAVLLAVRSPTHC